MALETHDSRCPVCGKLLTRPMLNMENVSLTDENYQQFKGGVKIEYGGQTKCRECKRVRETMTKAK